MASRRTPGHKNRAHCRADAHYSCALCLWITKLYGKSGENQLWTAKNVLIWLFWFLFCGNYLQCYIIKNEMDQQENAQLFHKNKLSKRILQ